MFRPRPGGIRSALRKVSHNDVKRVGILIAGGNEIDRHGRRALLSTEPGRFVCAEAGTGRQAVTMAAELRPMVTVFDMKLGFERFRKRRARFSRLARERYRS